MTPSEIIASHLPPTMLRVREQVVTVGVYVFKCPTCQRIFRYDDRYEPVCTGPSNTRDEHAPAVMQFVGIAPRRVVCG